jgi:hypothetical protein
MLAGMSMNRIRKEPFAAPNGDIHVPPPILAPARLYAAAILYN